MEFRRACKNVLLHYLRLLRRHMPYPYGLIIRTAGDELATRADPCHSYPFPVSRERLDAIARRDFPNLDRLVSRGAHYKVTLRHERNRVDVVIVAVHGLHASERLMEIPQLDGHVRAARSEQFARDIKRDVLHAVGVAFQRSLEITALKVPYLEEGTCHKCDE